MLAQTGVCLMPSVQAGVHIWSCWSQADLVFEICFGLGLLYLSIQTVVDFYRAYSLVVRYQDNILIGWNCTGIPSKVLFSRLIVLERIYGLKFFACRTFPFVAVLLVSNFESRSILFLMTSDFNFFNILSWIVNILCFIRFNSFSDLQVSLLDGMLFFA